MRPRRLIAWVLSLALVLFVGSPVVAHAGDGNKNKSQGHDEDKDNGKSNGKDNGKGNGKSQSKHDGDDDDHGDHHGDKHDDEDEGPRNDFALFDGSNPLNQPDAGAVCGASKGDPFTYHIAVANYGSDGFVRVTYQDGDWVQFPIAAGGSFSLSQAGGSKGGDDRRVRVSNGGSGAQLAGAMSAENAKCASCDADGGIGDAGCDEKVQN